MNKKYKNYTQFYNIFQAVFLGKLLSYYAFKIDDVKMDGKKSISVAKKCIERDKSLESPIGGNVKNDPISTHLDTLIS